MLNHMQSSSGDYRRCDLPKVAANWRQSERGASNSHSSFTCHDLLSLVRVLEEFVLRKFSRTVLALAALAALLVIVGCPTHSSIADINKDPGRYANKDVSIHGTVSEAFGALGNGVFQIDDGTGRMWVYSQNFGIPGNGNEISVTGRVQQGFAVGGRNFGVILRQTEARN